MRSTIKMKLIYGLVFLFIVIICFGTLGIFSVKRLSSDAGMILKDNHISVEFCSHMLKALDGLPEDTAQLRVFEHNLSLQEHNITEPGEYEATLELRTLFNQLKQSPARFTSFKQIRSAIFRVEDLNQSAIIHKNLVAADTAEKATLWLTIIVTLLSLVAFTFVLNFPAVISRPIRILTDGIREIANKNYSKRIHLDQKDEFGVLADTFNAMAEKLNEYEHSNLATIKLEKSRIEAIINKMNNGIIGLDEQKRVLFLNSEAEKLFNLQEDEIIGQAASEVAMINDLFRTVMLNEHNQSLKIFTNNKESYFDQETILIQTDSGIGGQVIILKNVTLFKELDAAKTNFIATISHELKTPLFSVKMGAQLLEDDRVGKLNTDQREILQSLKNNTERLLTITGELLNHSQLETGQIQLVKDSVQPAVIIDKAILAIEQYAADKHIDIRTFISADLPSLLVDEDKTTWVLVNLLSNAIKYSPEGEVVEIRAVKVNDIVQFSVTDHGIGIEEQYVSQVFKKYFKVPGSREKSGTGLGLSISKEFIEAQGGKIWVNSIFGAGSTFGFNFIIV
jgi:signal transduction histidine kinase